MGIYFFYHNSPKQRDSLKEAFLTLGQKIIIPSRVGGTQWLPHLLGAIKGYQAIKMQLDNCTAEKKQMWDNKGIFSCFSYACKWYIKKIIQQIYVSQYVTVKLSQKMLSVKKHTLHAPPQHVLLAFLHPVSHNAPFGIKICKFLFWRLYCGMDGCIVSFGIFFYQRNILWTILFSRGRRRTKQGAWRDWCAGKESLPSFTFSVAYFFPWKSCQQHFSLSLPP